MHLGTTELLLILALVIIVFGGTRIAGLGKAFGKSVREFKEEVKSDDKKEDDGAAVSQTSAEKAEEGTDNGKAS